jgi:rod shape determining protein RodA
MSLKKIHLSIVLPTLGLLTLSLLTLFSIAPSYFRSQLIFIIISLPLFVIASYINYQTYKKFSFLLYILAVLLLLLTLILGTVTRGSTRWLEFGSLRFQTSEFAKPLLILFFSSFLTNKSFTKIKNLVLYLLLVAVPVFLVINQPDLGSAVVLSTISLSFLIAKGIPGKWLIAIVLVMFMGIPIFWNLLQDYQKSRITAFLNPQQDPLGAGYHLIQSMTAVGSGRVFGKGLGKGTQSQLRFLPERHTDFIFASLAEELGFVGAVFLLICYFILLFKLLKTAHNSKNNYASLLSVGFFILFLVQILINTGMNLGLLPITGVTLPLVSSGGSSLLSMIFSLGITANISSEVKNRRWSYLAKGIHLNDDFNKHW